MSSCCTPPHFHWFSDKRATNYFLQHLAPASSLALLRGHLLPFNSESPCVHPGRMLGWVKGGLHFAKKARRRAKEASKRLS
eukprot:scaffold191535_cov20-Tisochrysis_lutea.AAC.1